MTTQIRSILQQMLLLYVCSTSSNCGLKEIFDAYAGPQNSCEQGCPEGAECRDKICQISTTKYSLILEVTPLASGSTNGNSITFPIATEQFRDQNFESNSNRNIVLPRIVTVLPKLETSLQTGVIPIDVEFRLKNSIVGNSLQIYKNSGASQLNPLTPFQVTLPTIGEFDLYIKPSAYDLLSRIPPWQGDKPFTFSAQGNNDNYNILIQYNPGAGHKLTLTLTDLSNTPFSNRLDGRNVYVVHRATNRLASTIANTCASPDKAELTLSFDLKQTNPKPSLSDYVVRIEPPSCPKEPSSTKEWLPSFDFGLETLGAEATQSGLIKLPSLTLASRTIATSIVVRNNLSQDIPIEGTVLFTSNQLNLEGAPLPNQAWYQYRVDVKQNNTPQLQLPPGIYIATVIPSNATSLEAVTAQKIEITKTTTELKLRVNPRTSIIGKAVSVMHSTPTNRQTGLFFLGEIEAVSSSSGYSSTSGVPLLTRANRTLFGDISQIIQLETPKVGGFFGLVLDPGRYDFIARVASVSNFPWAVRPNIEMGASTNTIDFCVSPPVVFKGQVKTQSGAVVPNARIQARGIVPNTDLKVPASSILVGETQTDAEGRYRLLLPSDLSSMCPENSPG